MLLAALLAAAAPPTCTLENAQPTTVREMAAAPDEWLGRCVRLEGYTTGSNFYEDRAAAYRYDAADKEDRPNDGWLGLYLRGKRAYKRQPLQAQVAGVLHDCGRDYEAADASLGPNEIVFTTGYCHYHGGLVLRQVAIRHGRPVALVRQVGERARRSFGDLLTVDEAGPPPAEPLQLLRRFVTAMRSGDSAGAAALAESYNWNIVEGPAGIARWRTFLTSGGPFAFLHKAQGPEPVFFRARQSRKDAGYGHTPHWFACFCKARDCSGLWPISVKDAAADADPAYACVRLYRQTGARPWEIGIDTRKAWSFAGRD